MKLIAKLAGFFDDLPDFMIWMLVGLCAIMGTFYIGQTNGDYAARLELTPQITELKRTIDRMGKAHKQAVTRLAEDNGRVYDDLALRYDKLRDTKQKTQTIIKEVPKYVTKIADAQCVIPAGFVHVHNATLAADPAAVPGGPPGDVDAPSGVALSAVADTLAYNNAECVERGTLLKMWQDWYPQVKENYERASAIMVGAAIQPAN